MSGLDVDFDRRRSASTSGQLETRGPANLFVRILDLGTESGQSVFGP